MNKKLAFSLLLLAFIGCGYKPSTYYTKPLLGDKISTQVDINVKNPTDSVFLNDALNEAVLAVFNSKVDNKKANSKISLSIDSASVFALDYDKNGYAILYRAKTSITAYITDVNNSTYSYSATGTYDFSIDKDSLLSDNIKHNAIKQAFLKALQKIEFKIANRGINDDN